MHILMCDAHHKMRLVLSDSEVVQAINSMCFYTDITKIQQAVS